MLYIYQGFKYEVISFCFSLFCNDHSTSVLIFLIYDNYGSQHYPVRKSSKEQILLPLLDLSAFFFSTSTYNVRQHISN